MNLLFKKENIALLFTYSRLLFDIGEIFNLKFDSKNRIIEWSVFNINWKVSENEIFDIKIDKYYVEYNQSINIKCPHNEFIIERINDSDYNIYRYRYHLIGTISYGFDKILIYENNKLFMECILKNEKIYKIIIKCYSRNHQIINHNDIQIIIKQNDNFEIFNFDEYSHCIEYKTNNKKFKFNYNNEYVNTMNLYLDNKYKIDIKLNSEGNILNKTEMKH